MHEVRILRDTEVPADLLTELRGLLVDAFAGDFAAEDWDHTIGGWRVVVLDDGVPVSHAALVPRLLRVGERDVRAGYVEGVGTARAHHGEGLGSQVMTEVGALVRSGFEMGALSTGLWAFYERHGWERWRGPTFVRDGAEHVRTPEEDNGVMVLRLDDVDLEAPITCEARPGDDW